MEKAQDNPSMATGESKEQKERLFWKHKETKKSLLH